MQAKNRFASSRAGDRVLVLRALGVGFAATLLLLSACVGTITDDVNRSSQEPDAAPREGGVGERGPDAARAPVPGAEAEDAASADPDAGLRGPDGAIPDASARAPDQVFSPLSVMAVVNPLDYGAAGDGVTDDLSALRATLSALPEAGGVVYFPEGRSFKKTDTLVITGDHVKLWSQNRQAELFQSVHGERRRQAILCRNNRGCGFFGLKLRSDAVARFDALEDNQIAADHADLLEVAGCEIEGSAAVGIFLYGSSQHYIEGNYVHHTWADHIHHTAGASASWVWNNFIFNEPPSRGDDGVACVTYGVSSARCRDMEWWNNRILRTGWGRGYAVIGGSEISIHHNWAIGVAGAGIIVASEGAYDSASSQAISILNNYVYQCGQTIAHPGILVSGGSASAGPLTDIALTGNVSVDTPAGPYRAEGEYANVTNTDLSSAPSALPAPMPSGADVLMADTRVLRTRDLSHVHESARAGLYRIHVRVSPRGPGFEQRFEYLVKGPRAALSAFVGARSEAGDYLVEQRASDGTGYALLLSAAPLVLPQELSGISFRELRANDRAEGLAWLWQRVDSGLY